MFGAHFRNFRFDPFGHCSFQDIHAGDDVGVSRAFERPRKVRHAPGRAETAQEPFNYRGYADDLGKFSREVCEK